MRYTSPTGQLPSRLHGARHGTAGVWSLVFPYGTVDTCRSDPLETVPREVPAEFAPEPSSMVVIGFLAPSTLPLAHLLVDPVLGWSTRPELVQSLHHTEVAAMHQVPFAEVAAWEFQSHARAHRSATPTSHGPDGPRLGRTSCAPLGCSRGLLAPSQPRGPLW